MLKHKPSRVICEVRVCGSTCRAPLSLLPFGLMHSQSRRGCGGAAHAPALLVGRKAIVGDTRSAFRVQGTPPIPASAEIPCR